MTTILHQLGVKQLRWEESLNLENQDLSTKTKSVEYYDLDELISTLNNDSDRSQKKGRQVNDSENGRTKTTTVDSTRRKLDSRTKLKLKKRVSHADSREESLSRDK